ncbi:MAG: pyridoxamine 5'-phosphate oxidase [Vulcanimicrobiaceae bacterium]
MSIETSRISYEHGELNDAAMAEDPLAQLRVLLDEAYAADLREPNAMSLATIDADGAPSVRIVLLRGLDARGIAFYTSYESRKGIAIAHESRVAATLFWAELERQVRLEGRAQRLSDDESDKYFATRPRGHQLGAWASDQSHPVDSRETLEERMHHFDERFEGEDIARPHSWGGYLIVPERMEFWQGRPNRIHDRIEYQRTSTGWHHHRLQP